MKTLFFLVMATAGLLLSGLTASAQTLLPSANKIIYSTNAVEVQDSTSRVAYTLKKGSFFVQTKGFTGGSAVIIEAHSGRAVWRGPVSAIRIVGVTASDSLKILSLKSSPF